MVELSRGVWLQDSIDEEVGRDVEALCSVLEAGLFDAFLSLTMFQDIIAADQNRLPLSEQWNLDRSDERRHREEVLEGQAPEDQLDGDAFGRAYHEVGRRVIRERWADGELPGGLRHRLLFLHARAFVTSLAAVGRALSALSTLETGTPQADLRRVHSQFEGAMPDLRPVRDSIEHAEDRMRGLDRRGERMDLTVLGGGSLFEDRTYGCTVDGGAHAEIEICEETLEVARAAVQAAFDALPWRPGPRRIEPSLSPV